MKTIIAGSRTIEAYAAVEEAVKASGFEITQVISGCARGVDRLGEQWGYAHDVSIARFPADWKRYGKLAGPIRNKEMAAYADALIAVWDGKSTGTGHMIRTAKERGLHVFVFVPRGGNGPNNPAYTIEGRAGR
jgi:predicted Rossmann fold nucleotide-binding protein DprA/Smf involved in DNA uptake